MIHDKKRIIVGAAFFFASFLVAFFTTHLLKECGGGNMEQEQKQDSVAVKKMPNSLNKSNVNSGMRKGNGVSAPVIPVVVKDDTLQLPVAEPVVKKLSARELEALINKCDQRLSLNTHPKISKNVVVSGGGVQQFMDIEDRIKNKEWLSVKVVNVGYNDEGKVNRVRINPVKPLVDDGSFAE